MAAFEASTTTATRGAPLVAYAAFALPLTMTALPINILLPDFYAAQTGLSLATIGFARLTSPTDAQWIQSVFFSDGATHPNRSPSLWR